jgi:RHS repeat-associated protein
MTCIHTSGSKTSANTAAPQGSRLTSVGRHGSGEAATQDRSHDAANELTSISGSWIDPTYDDAGNMISGPKPGAETDRLHFTYDAWNRLVAVWADDEGEAGDLIASYQYDGLGRRTVKIVRQVDGEEVRYQRTDYLYDEQWQVLEDRADTFEDLEGEGGALATVAETVNVQWLWDQRYIDAPVLRWRDADADPETGQYGLDETLYYCNDANMNVTALVDAETGEVVERYMYDPYGKATVCEEDWTPREGNASAVANDVLYCGYRFDAETGLYSVRFRYYHPTLGRWIERDPVPARPGLNLTQYAISSSPNYTDPYGLRDITIKIQVTGEMPQTWPGDRVVEQAFQKVLDTCFKCCQDKVTVKIERSKQRVETGQVDSRLGLFPKPKRRGLWPFPQQPPPTEWRQEVYAHRGSAVAEIAYTHGSRTSISSTVADTRFSADVKATEYAQTWGNILAHEILYHGMLGQSDVLAPDKDTPEMYTNKAPSSHPVQVPKEMCDKLKKMLQVTCEEPTNAK